MSKVEVYPSKVFRNHEYSLRVTVPAEICKNYGIEPGDVLIFVEQDDQIRVVPKLNI